MWPARILDLPYHVEVLFIFLFHLLNHPPFQCSPGVHVHPYQHSPAQRSVPHCVTSSVSVIHPAGDSTPTSVQPAKFKYTGSELLALAAPVGQRLKPELISTLKKRWALDVGCLVAGRAAVVHGKSVQYLWRGPAAFAAVTFHLPPCLLLFATTFLAPLLRLAATRTI